MLKDLEKIKDWTLDLFFPIQCINCGKEGKYICDDCDVFLSENSLICPVCQRNNLFGERHDYCSDKDSLEGLISIWDFEGLSKTLINKIKKEGASHIIPTMICKSFSVIAEDKQRFKKFLSFLFSKNTCVSFVPSDKKEEKRRGFNQAELIAKELARISGLRTIDLLETDNDLEGEKRFFSKKESPENVILVDDFWRTGATMKKCCTALKNKGAKKIWGFVLFRSV